MLLFLTKLLNTEPLKTSISTCFIKEKIIFSKSLFLPALQETIILAKKQTSRKL